MVKLKPDTVKLLRLVCAEAPMTRKAIVQVGRIDFAKERKRLVDLGLIFITAPGSQWERMFPTEEGVKHAG